jgi:methanogenic corrinoid protein MtbC1
MSERLDDLHDARFETPARADAPPDPMPDLLAHRRPARALPAVGRLSADLKAAVLEEDAALRVRAVGAMRAAGLPLRDIMDVCIPEAARLLGAEWHDNTRSFADVTIGTARLQALLRELGEEECREFDCDALGPGVAVVVLEHEAHTLGSSLLCQQLRRLGASVQLLVGQCDADVVRCVAEAQFDAVLISAARSEALASARKLVDKLKAPAAFPVPIVIGGAVVSREPDVKMQTGADHVATDAKDALVRCGLKISPQGALRRAAME